MLSEATRKTMDLAESKTTGHSLRFAAPGDVDAIVSLINSAFNPVESEFVEGDRIDSDGIRHYLQTGNYLVSEIDGTLAACIYIELRGPRAYLGMLSVAPTRQSAGLGRRLMSAAEEYCREQGCLAVDLRVINRRSELVAMYRRFGYSETGTEPVPATALHRFKMPCHFITMSKSLHP